MEAHLDAHRMGGSPESCRVSGKGDGVVGVVGEGLPLRGLSAMERVRGGGVGARIVVLLESLATLSVDGWRCSCGVDGGEFGSTLPSSSKSYNTGRSSSKK